MISLLLLSFVMLVGCYIAGCIPLAFNFSSAKMRYVTIFGAGLLLGTALTVIIPEGIHSMYSESILRESLNSVSKESKIERKLLSDEKQNHHIREVNLESIVDHMKVVNQATTRQRINFRGFSKAGKLLPVHGVESKQVNVAVAGSKKDVHEHGGHRHSEAAYEDVHKKIGISLIVGFIFMLVVDHISTLLVRKGSFSSSSSSSLETMEGGGGEMIVMRRRSRSSAATVGLVMHAAGFIDHDINAADGVALGAASSMSHFRLEIIVFLAIMLHKAPAAFGFVSFLLHDNMERPKIRRHLLLFSLAAPVMAILTYMCLNDQAREHLQDVNATGLALLFSAGTFLYVATVHVLPELAQHPPSMTHPTDEGKHSVVSLSSSSSTGNGNSELAGSILSTGAQSHTASGFTLCELLLIILGSVCPLVLSIGHSHG